MANRRPQGNRRMDFGRNDRGPKNFGRSGVSPWQGGGPGGGMPNLLPLSGGSTEATLALASNIINLLQPRPNPVPSLLDMPIRRDFGPNMGRYDRPFGPNRMGNQGNFRRSGNYNRTGERINTNRKPFRPYEGQRQQNKSPQKKDADSKAKNVMESGDGKAQGENETGKPEEKRDGPKTRYDDINPEMLRCHICNKSMWDGRSFENHLTGRAHAIMMQKTAESYALTADTMRQEFKIREMKRARKSGLQPPRDFYCAMCDLYAADGVIHRTTVGHRKLKKYLHPTCTSCHKEMPTRIELDEHRLTAEHLRTMQDKTEVVAKPKPEVMVISTLNMEQMYLRDDRQRWPTDQKKEVAVKTETVTEEKQDGEGEVVKEGEESSAEKKTEEEEPAKHHLDKDDTILDYKEGDDLTNVTAEMLPVYSTERGVGRSFLTEFRCVQCTLCRKLLDSESTAEVHLRTWRHYQLFSRLLAEKSGTRAANETAKRTHDNDDEGNWKRRKTTEEEGGAPADRNGHEDGNDDAAAADEQDNLNKDLEDVDIKDGDEDGHGGADCPDDELEDWEQSVDEILKEECQPDTDDKNDNEDDLEDDLMQDEETPNATEEVVKPESPKPTPNQTTPATPVQATPVTPAKATPVPATPAKATPVPATPVPATPVPATPTQAAPAIATPAAQVSPKPKNTPRGRGRGRRRY